ncbi:ABC transporter ATP-binding protein [Oceanivirga salmonicida]|uniref:ABC transporter ATP-binding protein n=1 Tax=Oceanivirga salmonicida TaxID=1769291 RepID=UPI000831A977|nr:ABC transporter ATP-binding protein [Oceanivirga salmonicida]
MNNAIEVMGVSKRYSSGFEISNISFEIKKGYITGFIGKNGAGKTTVIKMILDILHPDSGNINIFDINTKGRNYNLNEKVGFVIEDMFFPDELKVKELDIVAKDIFKNWDSKLFYQYISKFELPLNSKIKELSKGMKKKLQISFALSYNPKLLIFDEATSGLDPVIRREILDIFLEYMKDEENTIFISTHITSDLDKIADDIIMIDNGSIVLRDCFEDIKNEYGILKCSENIVEKLDKKTILAKVSTKYHWEVLINNKNELLKDNPDYIVENVDLEKLMFLLSKGRV